MDPLRCFQMLARYNRIANQRLYAACTSLDVAEYRKPRCGSWGSIHALLNHILLGDRIWMARFEGGGQETPPLDTALFDELRDLRGRAGCRGRADRSLFRAAGRAVSGAVLPVCEPPG